MVHGEYNRNFKKVIYPSIETHELRNFQTNRQHAQVASITGEPVYGVKGPSTLSELLRIPDDIPFDPMHLLYIGINKSLLNAIIKHKLVNCNTMSLIIEKIKVPHYFRRNPRNFLTEYALWKAQEHRHFLIYFAPIVFLAVTRLSPTPFSNQLFQLYHLLSTAIYLLHDADIRESDILSSEVCIREFQLRIVDILGESVKTITLHALQHLPAQVRKFGPLHTVSAMPFENLNRQLKTSVTGTRGSALTVVYRYLNFQSFLDRTFSQPTPAVLGKSIPYRRFKVGCLVFHTYKYDKGKNSKNASCFAFLSADELFVKIKGINYDSHKFSVVCRTYNRSSLMDFNSAGTLLSADAATVLKRKSPFHLLKKGNVKEFCPSKFSHHAVITDLDGCVFGVKIMNTFEHD